MCLAAKVRSAYPPGVKEQFIDYLNQAQQYMFSRIEMDEGAGTAPARMSADTDETTLDYLPIAAYALGLAQAHYGQGDAKIAFQEFEKYLADQAMREPPGFDAEMKAALQNAQQTVYRRFPMSNTGTFTLSPFEADTDKTSVDFQPVLSLAVANLKAKYRQDDAKLVLEEYERYMSDLLARAPPGLDEEITQSLQNAQQSVYRRYAMGNTGAFALDPFSADTDKTTVDFQPVYLLAVATMKARMQRADAKIAMEEYERYMTDLVARTPPNAKNVVTQYIIGAQSTLYYRYEMFRARRWFSWNMLKGGRFYSVDGNYEAQNNNFTLDPRTIEWVGVSEDSRNWRELSCGIDPSLYRDNADGVPLYYDVGECIEVWPAANEDNKWTLRIKGRFGLLPFVEDSDDSTIDPHAIYLAAVADAKYHYGQPDAGLYEQRLRVYLGDLTAGTHMTRRYIAGRKRPEPYVPPAIGDPP